MKLSALTLALPVLLSPPCEAVRRQASRFAPRARASVQPYSHGAALAPGMEMKGRLQALPQDMHEAAELLSGPGAEQEARDWVADFFEGDDTEASEFPMNFGLDELDGPRSVSHLGLEDQGSAAHGRIEWTAGVEQRGERKRTSGPGAKRRSQTRDADLFRGDDTEASEFPMNFGFDELEGVASVSHLGMKDQGEAAHGRIDWTDEDGSPLFKWRVHGI